MINISHYFSYIYMHILLINALIIYFGLQPINPDTLVEQCGRVDSNVDHSTQGIYFLFNFFIDL